MENNLSNGKPPLRIAIFGHVDSGKTTLAVQFSYQCGLFDSQVFHQLEQKVIGIGRNYLKYIYIADLIGDHSSFLRGDDDGTMSWQFETEKHRINLTDARRYRRYTLSIIRRSIDVDCLLWILPASIGEFEASLSKYSEPRMHLLIARMINVKCIVIAINKMDQTDPPFSEERFNEIRIETLAYLKRIGYQPEYLIMIPVSAWQGDNLTKPSVNMPWFRGWTFERDNYQHTCRTLLEALDSIVVSPPPIDKPLRLILQSAIISKDRQTILTGRIESGVLKQSMMVHFLPSELIAQVTSIEINREVLHEALPRDIVQFTIPGCYQKVLAGRSICSDPNHQPAQLVTSFLAEIGIIFHANGITEGQSYVIHGLVATVMGTITTLCSKLNLKTNEIIEARPTCLKSNEIGLVKIILARPACFEKCSDNASLGHFVLVDQDQLIGAGQIKEIG